ncbi:hypothetical protein [Yersinia ruckeri]|uniref:hypothetical protein n=1 Tax=Yersinia ruckeri TaxID=29486 RepID=UPI000691F123|nr:hypothetical protein [Yersinia ruckeri]AUQ43833.1 hypothetical protein NJ56_17835 [Yersinia ruckeri]
MSKTKSTELKDLKTQLDIVNAKLRHLVIENSSLIETSARELSNSWLLFRTFLGAQIALHCLQLNNMSEAQRWLDGTIEGAIDESSLEIPADISISDLQVWFDKKMVGNITHAKAVDIIKAEVPVTTQALLTSNHLFQPWRSFVTHDDISALKRFTECCDDPDSGGHDLEPEQVQRLIVIGVLRKIKRNYHEMTDFGDYVISAVMRGE